MWNRWPSAGPAEVFGDAETYRREIDALIATGAAFDRGMVYLVARLAAEYPTVEIRVADVCTALDDALLVAALVRAVADTAATQWASGVAPPAWRTELIGASTGRAARFGLSGRLVHPETRVLVPVREAFAALIEFATDSLEETGDRPTVDELFEQLLSRGSGAARQRSAYEAGGSLEAVVHDLIARTEASYTSA
jgi:carboxylate-amine ligase